MTLPADLSARVRRGTLVASVVLAGLLTHDTAGQSAQEPQDQPPVFRAGTTFVRVDAYPRRDGRLVDDLRAEDFQIFENGKLQTVETFELVRIAVNTPDAERRDPTSVADAFRQVANPRNRVFVVYLDMYHMPRTDSQFARQPLVEFLTRAIGPSDLFAVTTPETPVRQLTFGRRTETLENELSTVRWGVDDGRGHLMPRTETEEKLLGCSTNPEVLVRAHRDDRTETHLRALIGTLGDLRDERKNILFVSGGWPLRRALPRGRGIGPEKPTIGVGPGGRIGTGITQLGYTDGSWCNSQMSQLQSIDPYRNFRDIVDLARRSNVAFYPIWIDPEDENLNLTPSMTGPSPRHGGLLLELAETTDGAVILGSREDLAIKARQLADDLAAFYLLGYYSTNTAADGRYRSIEVKVNRRDVDVSARRGYLAPTEAMRRAEAAAAARPVTGPTAVDRALERLARVRPDRPLNIDARVNGSTLDVIVEIASREMDTGQWRSGGPVTVSATVAGMDPLVGEGRVAPGLRGTVVQIPLPMTPPAAGARRWRLSARVNGSNRTLDGEETIDTAPASLVGAPLVYRAAPSPQSPLGPVADLRFRRTERIHVEWPVTGALTSPAAQVLSRRGDALPVLVTTSERTDAAGSALVVADFVLSPLAQGDYVLELAATSGASSVQHLVAFRVVP